MPPPGGTSPPPGGAPPPPGGTPPPPPVDPPPSRVPLDVVARGDRRTFVGALVVGVAFAIAAQTGLVALGGFLLALVLVGALFATRRLRSGWSRVLAAGVPVLAAALVLRTSPWVIVPVVVAMVLLLALAVSFANARSLGSTFPQLGVRLGLVLDHVVLGPGMLRLDETAESPQTRQRFAAMGRGGLLALPVLCIVGGLLGMADPVFRSWFDPPQLLQNVALIAVGGWVLLGLVRAASAKSPTLELRDGPRLGTVEVVSVLGSLSALYAVFVASQVVAAFDGADHVESTRGLTYADYAREGFFQLLAAAAVTLIVILGVRACADRSRLSVLVVSEITVALTLVVVAVAIFRLELYRDAFGLTPLRLASSVTAIWIGVVFLMLAGAIARGARSNAWYGTAVLLTGVIFVAVWSAANPAAVVATVNMDRAARGESFDPELIEQLGADALPTVARDLSTLDAREQELLRQLVCEEQPDSGSGLGANRSMDEASRALASMCSEEL